MLPFSRRILFDDRRGSPAGEEFPECVAVVRGIAEQGFRRRQCRDQSWRWFDVMAIAAGQFKADEPAFAIDDGVDFGGAPAPALADRLLLGPPFPPAAHRWAFAVVLSMH